MAGQVCSFTSTVYIEINTFRASERIQQQTELLNEQSESFFLILFTFPKQKNVEMHIMSFPLYK